MNTRITVGQKKNTGSRSELEGTRNGGRYTGLDFDAFTGEEVLQVFHIKARDTAFKKGVTLSELMFKMFGMATKGESLAMPVFLVAGGSGGCAGGASRMLRVAL